MMYVINIEFTECVVHLTQQEAQYVREHIGKTLKCEDCDGNNPCFICAQGGTCEIYSIEPYDPTKEINRGVVDTILEHLRTMEDLEKDEEDEEVS